MASEFDFEINSRVHKENDWATSFSSSHALNSKGADLLPEPKSNVTALKEKGFNALQIIDEHPIASIATLSAIAGAAIIGKRFFSPSASSIASSEFRASEGLLRGAAGEVLPNIERPFISELTDTAAMIGKSRDAYGKDLAKLWAQPRTAQALEGESFGQFAERMIAQRAPITGERINAEKIGKELAHLGSINAGGLSEHTIISGQTLNITSREHLVHLAEEMQFKHVPQIGQFLKSTGRIGEKDIEAALQIQKAAPTPAPKIGEILVNNKLATQSDVDLAFANQTELKDVLKALRTKFLAVQP